MKNNIYRYIAPVAVSALSALPAISFAATGDGVRSGVFSGQSGDVPAAGVFGLLRRVQDFMNLLVPIIITLGLLYFLWGVVQYIQSPDDREKARDTMIGGILALFVMVSVWGLVNLFAATIGLENSPSNPNQIPFVQPEVGPSRTR